MSNGDTRDKRAIAAIECPRCHAPAGKPCKFPSAFGRPSCHDERRRANQERLRAASAIAVAPINWEYSLTIRRHPPITEAAQAEIVRRVTEHKEELSEAIAKILGLKDVPQ